jgi:hypothetical protein
MDKGSFMILSNSCCCRFQVRTFGYPFLHLDEASFNAPVDVESRVPWGVLVSLNERIPYEHDEHTGAGAFALVSLRIRELYEAGRKWQGQ